jgi:hypothetical protein
MLQSAAAHSTTLHAQLSTPPVHISIKPCPECILLQLLAQLPLLLLLLLVDLLVARCPLCTLPHCGSWPAQQLTACLTVPAAAAARCLPVPTPTQVAKQQALHQHSNSMHALNTKN